jgi:putative transposase
MALDQSALLEVLDVLKSAEVDDRIRQAAETIYQALIEAELTAVIGAAPHQRTETRTGLRNGRRQRTITTMAGDLELKIPRLRTGSFFPSLLERRRRVDHRRHRHGLWRAPTAAPGCRRCRTGSTRCRSA